MASKKTIYRTVHPETGQVFFPEKGGKLMQWATYIDFGQGEGLVHVGYSNQQGYDKASRAAKGTNPYGKRYDASPVTVVTAEERDAELAAQAQAPAAQDGETELCASNSRVKGMHYRVKGQQVSLCGKAKTSRKPNAQQLADDSVCLACVAARQD